MTGTWRIRWMRMESAGFAKAIVVEPFLDAGCDGAGGGGDDGEDVGVGEGGGNQKG